MIEQIYKKIYFITGLLYNSNKDKELIMKQTEDDEYKKLSYEELNKLYDFLELFTSSIGLEYLPNYELSYLNKVDYLVIKRMQEKTFMYLNQYVEYDSNKSKKYGIKYDKNNLLVINNYEQALSEVYIKILNLISAKLLYFINKSNDITEDTKNKINKNYYFITQNIDTKIEDIIKEESHFYNNLWDDIKLEYDGFLRDFLMTEIAGVINVMLYDDLNDIEENALHSIYLRSLFSFLDTDKLEQLNYDFNEIDLSDANIVGIAKIRNAFRNIDKDREDLNKIKEKK